MPGSPLSSLVKLQDLRFTTPDFGKLMHTCTLSCSVVSNSCDPVNCSPTGSSLYGILHERILERVAISLLWGIFLTQGLNLRLLLGRWILYHRLTWEALGRLRESVISLKNKETFNPGILSHIPHLSPMHCSCTLAIPTSQHPMPPWCLPPGKTSSLVTLGCLPSLLGVLNMTEDKAQTKPQVPPSPI